MFRVIVRFTHSMGTISLIIANIAKLAGHVDAGKSTLMGHVLYQLGFVNKRTMHKYEQESKKLGKASFAYAWVLDETEEERSTLPFLTIASAKENEY